MDRSAMKGSGSSTVKWLVANGLQLCSKVIVDSSSTSAPNKDSNLRHPQLVSTWSSRHIKTWTTFIITCHLEATNSSRKSCKLQYRGSCISSGRKMDQG